MSDNDSPKDPFAAFESDRTVIKPSAGRGARASAAPPPAAAAAPAASTGGSAALPDLPPHASLNPLVQAAAPLLSAAPRLRAMVRHPNPAALRALQTAFAAFFDPARIKPRRVCGPSGALNPDEIRLERSIRSGEG